MQAGALVCEGHHHGQDHDDGNRQEQVEAVGLEEDGSHGAPLVAPGRRRQRRAGRRCRGGHLGGRVHRGVCSGPIDNRGQGLDDVVQAGVGGLRRIQVHVVVGVSHCCEWCGKRCLDEELLRWTVRETDATGVDDVVVFPFVVVPDRGSILESV